jgi:hypothetical protein
VSLGTPSYRLHKPSGQAIVALDQRDIYLGLYGLPQSQPEYDRLIAEWLLNGRRLRQPAYAGPGDITVNELALAYLAFAAGSYVKNGQPTAEATTIGCAVRALS